MARVSKPLVSTYGSLWARNSDNIKQLRALGRLFGIYVLYDGSMPVYIGRGRLQTDRPPPTEQESRPVRDQGLGHTRRVPHSRARIWVTRAGERRKCDEGTRVAWEVRAEGDAS